ncbi:uncharacterized protein A4U43_C01F13030 [Asparagus officinalis]|uniref:60S acidic ribosomal protein P1 n=1 Tax=Asparagus officinalis TaxID=4686 RepID=A0A5P1FTM3_ASPOF|nr:60S acidic ribosomal protein P1-like [Asparagus officinalis]ONK80030.1 uncharacterized protein A4U43_C01F13030 [Asparagus officinalis]
MSMGDVACSYAALILHDEGIPITADKISTLVKGANIQIESYWAPLFRQRCSRTGALMISSRGIGPVSFLILLIMRSSFIVFFDWKFLSLILFPLGLGGGGAAAAPPPAAAAAPAARPAVEEKKEEPKEESDDDMGFSLFD